MKEDLHATFRSLLRLALERPTTSGALEQTLRKSSEAAILHGLGLTKSFATDSAILELVTVVTLSPRVAIDYETTNPMPRWRLIADHLRIDLPFMPDRRLEDLSRRMASLLDDWDEERLPPRGLGGLGRVRHCAICRVNPSLVPESLAICDPYKPYHEAPAELLRLEVDHIVPVALAGTRSRENQQVLCRACNLAKGAGLEIAFATELEFASSELADIPRAHRFRMLQWVIVNSGGACPTCGDGVSELTVRLLDESMTYMRANLRATCYSCADVD